MIINIIAINVMFFFFIFIIFIISFWLLLCISSSSSIINHHNHHHHHHRHHHHYHHYHHYYYNFIIILAIITLVWRICILHHNQSLNFFVILKHLHFWAEQPSFLNPFIFPTFPFSSLTIRVVPWGTTITWQLYNNILAFYLKTLCYAEDVQCRDHHHHRHIDYNYYFLCFFL